MMPTVRIHLDGKDYLWTGTEWVEAETFLVPPESIVRRLNPLLEDALQHEEQSLSDISELLRRGSVAREAHQYRRAETLARRALQLSPGNHAALAVLCAALRGQNCPQQALEETEAFKQAPHPALLTSRAAALCDLNRWEEAKRTVGRALAIESGSDEAFRVVSRIKAIRPDLYD